MSGAGGAYLLWVAALAAALSWPVSRLIWVVSVRRLERRLERILDAAEIAGQRRRAWLIAVVVCLAFSALFNLRLLARGG